MKKKNNLITNEESSQINYKQLSKLKYLNNQSEQLTKLISQLKTIYTKSKSVLQIIQQNSSKLNSTACSIGHILDPGFPENQIEQLNKNIIDIQIKIQNTKKQLENKIIMQQRNKKQQQAFYRKILYNYQQKLTQLKNSVLNRESYIQKIEKNKKQSKPIIINSKCLLMNANSIELIQARIKLRQKFIQQIQNGISLKLQINQNIKQIKKMQKLSLKYCLAQQTKMPYYKFKDMIKNGIERMTEADIRQYEYISKIQEKINKQIKQRSKINLPLLEITKQNLYLIIKKQKMNKQLLQNRIERQMQKQIQLKQKNNKLKQAISDKQQDFVFKKLHNYIESDRNYFQISKWKSYSQKNGHLPIPVKLQCNTQQYKLYIEFLNKYIHKLPQINVKNNNRILNKSKSTKDYIKKWDEDEVKICLQVTDELSFFNKESFYDKCQNFITQRFYEDTEQIQV